MVVGIAIVTIGACVLLMLTFSGRLADHGRQPEQHLLVAPRNAGFGAATRLTREAATAQNPVRLTVLRPETALPRSDRRAA